MPARSVEERRQRDEAIRPEKWSRFSRDNRVDRSRGHGVVLLDGKLSSLIINFVSLPFFSPSVKFGSGIGFSYRQHSQQGGFPCVL